MIKLTDSEFDNCIRRLINGEITRVKLAEELKTDTRTLLNRIYKIDNDELFKEYVKKFPYKPKKNENINYEKLIIEIIKHEETIEYVEAKYHIAGRTYRRNIERLKRTNIKLYTIYKDYIHNHLTDQDKYYIYTLQEGQVSTTDKVEGRETYLIDMFNEYDELLANGLIHEEALEKLNETNKSFKRKYDEFNRIIKENEIKENDVKEQKKSKFISGLKVKQTPIKSYGEDNRKRNEEEREL